MSKREKRKADERKSLRISCKGKAKLSGLNMSARKIRVLFGMIKNVSVEKALTSLSFQRKAAAKPLIKLIDSAVSNAMISGLDIDKLFIKSILIDKGKIRRRFMPRAQGRATRIRKQTSHIKVLLSEM